MTMTRHRALIVALASAAALAACEKTAVQDITGPIAESKVKFFNFGVNAPSVNFYANSAKMSAVSSALCSPTPTDTVQQRICREAGQEVTAGVAYGGVGSGGFYSSVVPGTYTLTGKIS